MVKIYVGGILQPENLVYNTTAVSGNATYTVVNSDNVLYVTTGSAGDAIIALPTAAGAGAGRILIAIKIDTGTNHVVVTPNAAASDSCEGSSTKTLTTQYQKIAIISDGVHTWYDLGTGGGI